MDWTPGAPARDGERERGFEGLVLSMQEEMFRAVWRVVRDADLAEEAMQNALTTLWRKSAELQRHPNPRALVLRVCLDAACDQARARNRRDGRFQSLEAIGSDPPAPEEQSAEQRTAVHEILSAITRLRSRQATALLMRVLHEAPYDAIAAALGCSAVTARVHVLQARRELRRTLGIAHRRSGRDIFWRPHAR